MISRLKWNPLAIRQERLITFALFYGAFSAIPQSFMFTCYSVKTSGKIYFSENTLKFLGKSVKVRKNSTSIKRQRNVGFACQQCHVSNIKKAQKMPKTKRKIHLQPSKWWNVPGYAAQSPFLQCQAIKFMRFLVLIIYR